MDDNYDLLSKEALNYSMEMIKNDLNKLGVSHDNFVSEKSIVEKKNVESAIKKLRLTKHVEEGYLDPPKGEDHKNWNITQASDQLGFNCFAAWIRGEVEQPSMALSTRSK